MAWDTTDGRHSHLSRMIYYITRLKWNRSMTPLKVSPNLTATFLMYWNLMSSVIRKNRTSDSNRLANRFDNIKFKWSIYQRAGCWRNAVNNTTTYSLISFPCGSNHCVFRLLIGILISGHYTLVSLNDTVYVQQSTIKTRGRVLHSQMT